MAAAFYTAMTVSALGFTAWLALRRRPLDPVFSAAAVLVVAVATAPIVQPWYLLWVLPLLACALRPLPWGADHPRWLGWVTALAVLLLTGVGVVDQLSVAQWLPVLAVRVFTLVLMLAGIGWIIHRDPVTAPLFPGRRRPPWRWSSCGRGGVADASGGGRAAGRAARRAAVDRRAPRLLVHPHPQERP